MNLNFTLVSNAINKINRCTITHPFYFMYEPELFQYHQIKNLRKIIRNKFQCLVHNTYPETWSGIHKDRAACVPKALILYNPKGIWVNPQLSLSTQHFTLIHELLHWVLNHDCVSRPNIFDELDVGICQYLIYVKLGLIDQTIHRISQTLKQSNDHHHPSSLLHSDMNLYAINNSIKLLEVANTIYQNIKT